MPVGAILLTILLVMIAFDLADGVISRTGFRRSSVWLLVAAALLGGALQVTVAPGLRINAGSTLVPFALAVWLFAVGGDRLRIISSGAVTAAAICLIGRWFPPGPPTVLNLFGLDAQYLYAVTGGTVAAAVSRTRTGALASAMLGILWADLTHWMILASKSELRTPLVVGGGGSYQTAAVAGVLALMLVHGLGNAPATAAGQPQPSGRPIPALTPATRSGIINWIRSSHLQ